jgi:multiple sugar transport system permease protein
MTEQSLVIDRMQSARPVAWRRISASPAMIFLPAFVLVMAVALVPIGYAFYQSVHASRYLNIGAFVGFDNFVKFFAGRDGIWNSVVFTIGSVGLAVPLGLAVAVALTRIERGRNVFRTILITPWLISNIAVAQLWGWLMNPDLGPVGHAVFETGMKMPNPISSATWAMPFLILVYTWTAFPLVMVMGYAALQTEPLPGNRYVW